MNHISRNKNDDVICRCAGVTKADIMKLIDNGSGCIAEISKITGACSGCGACEEAISELLAVE